jgi:nucleoside 2-deoxyribosyltransferase
MRKIYLAGPYSSPDAKVREERFRSLNAKAGELIKAGYVVFSPISHAHSIAEQCELPKGWEFWREYCESFVEWADEVQVLMLEGWMDSVGVKAEVEVALRLKKAVNFVGGAYPVDRERVILAATWR